MSIITVTMDNRLQKTSNLKVIILAAGKGTRMNSELPKVVHKTLQGTMIQSVIEAASRLNPAQICIVTGFKKEIVEKTVLDSDLPVAASDICFAHQNEQLGTGHAVKTALECPGFIVENNDKVLILYGDTPLISAKTLVEFLNFHSKQSPDLSLITAYADKSSAYGRIIRGADNNILKIVERKDCSESQAQITEVNSGLYLANADFLKDAVFKIKNQNSQKEFYLTDLVEIAIAGNGKVAPFFSQDSTLLQGVNSSTDLVIVNKIIMENKIKELLNEGVQVIDPGSTYIDPNVKIGKGSVIGPNTQIKGKTTIGQRVIIEGTALIIDSTIGNDCNLKLGLRIEETTINNNVSVGPFANLRPQTLLEDEVRIGNFVETKKAHLKKGAKANHLTYLGDAVIGNDTNIGAGTITCNYDGVKKSVTTIGDNVFIGSNSSLVAPVTIEDSATIGAGSVITKTIEAGSLGFTRASLTVKKNYKRK